MMAATLAELARDEYSVPAADGNGDDKRDLPRAAAGGPLDDGTHAGPDDPNPRPGIRRASGFAASSLQRAGVASDRIGNVDGFSARGARRSRSRVGEARC